MSLVGRYQPDPHEGFIDDQLATGGAQRDGLACASQPGVPLPPRPARSDANDARYGESLRSCGESVGRDDSADGHVDRTGEVPWT